jgi:hypothetical protein
MDTIGKYEKLPFPRTRDLVIDVVTLARLKHHVPVLLELDVGRGRESIRLHKKKTGKQISFTGWIAKCIAMAVSEHPEVHALRIGKRSMVVFQDVDILITVQKQTNEGEIPLPYIVRRANCKNVYEINDEIRIAQGQDATSQDMVLGKNPWYASIYLRLPRVVRYALGRVLLKNPFGIKRNTGTVGISSIGMMGNFGGWAIPMGPLPLQFGIGSISKKPWVYQDTIQIREVLNMAFVFDHDVVDGAPIARFIGRLTELIQNGEGFDGRNDALSQISE